MRSSVRPCRTQTHALGTRAVDLAGVSGYPRGRRRVLMATPFPRRRPRSKENDMSSTKHRLATILGAAFAAPLLAAGIAQADTPPSHVGNTALWGPAVANLCTNPAAAAAAGYNVIQ